MWYVDQVLNVSVGISRILILSCIKSPSHFAAFFLHVDFIFLLTCCLLTLLYYCAWLILFLDYQIGCCSDVNHICMIYVFFVCICNLLDYVMYGQLCFFAPGRRMSDSSTKGNCILFI